MLATGSLFAQPDSSPESPPRLLDVTIEVYGLRESTELLDTTMRELSATLSAMAASPEDLTPEQLAALTGLVQETSDLVAAINQILNGLGPAIRDAEAPTRAVVAGVLDTTMARAVEPALASVDRRVRGWLLLTIAGALLVVAITGTLFYLSTRQLRAMAATLRAIADDYQIVPRQKPGVATAPEPVAEAAPARIDPGESNEAPTS